MKFAFKVKEIYSAQHSWCSYTDSKWVAPRIQQASGLTTWTNLLPNVSCYFYF